MAFFFILKRRKPSLVNEEAEGERRNVFHSQWFETGSQKIGIPNIIQFCLINVRSPFLEISIHTTPINWLVEDTPNKLHHFFRSRHMKFAQKLIQPSGLFLAPHPQNAQTYFTPNPNWYNGIFKDISGSEAWIGRQKHCQCCRCTIEKCYGVRICRRSAYTIIREQGRREIDSQVQETWHT